MRVTMAAAAGLTDLARVLLLPLLLLLLAAPLPRVHALAMPRLQRPSAAGLSIPWSGVPFSCSSSSFGRAFALGTLPHAHTRQPRRPHHLHHLHHLRPWSHSTPCSARLKGIFAEKAPSGAEGMGEAADSYSGNQKTSAGAVAKPKEPERVQSRRLSLLLWRFSVLSWWSQVILSVVAGVTLTFANAVTDTAQSRNIFINGLGLSGGGLFFGFASIVWTSGYHRLARNIRLRRVDTSDIGVSLRKRLRTGATLNLVGSFLALLSAQEIAGFLLARALSFQSVQTLGTPQAPYGIASAVKPLDIFVVQANTNILCSHFLSLAGTLWFMTRLPGLTKK